MQKRYQQALEVVHSNTWIPEIVRKRVPDRRVSHSKSPAASYAETVTRYDQKTIDVKKKSFLHFLFGARFFYVF